MRKLIRRLLLSFLILHLISRSAVADKIDENSYFPPPLIEHDLSLTATQDTYAKEQIWYGLPYNSRYILLGYDSVYKHMRTRPQLGFDFSLLEPYESKDIYKAYISIWNWRPLNTNQYSVKVYPITQGWNERTVDWNNQPSVGEFHNLQQILPAEGWQYFEVTNILKEMKDSDQQIYGFALHKDLEYEFGAYYCSSNYLTSTIINDGCSQETIPQLIIQLNKQLEAPKIEISYIGENKYIIKSVSTYNEELIYELSTSLDGAFTTSVININSTGEFILSDPEPGNYYYKMRIRFRDSTSDWSNVITIEISDNSDEDYENETPKDQVEDSHFDSDDVSDKTENSSETKDQVQKSESQDNSSIPVGGQIAKEDILIPEIESAVLGTKDSFYDCKIVYNISRKTARSPWCNIPKLKIAEITNQRIQDKSKISIRYTQPTQINIIYEEVECQTKSVTNPKTWFSCVEQIIFSRGYYQTVNYSGTLYIKSERKSFILTSKDKSHIEGVAIFTKDLSPQSAELKHYVNFSFKPSGRVWIDITRVISTETIKIPKAISNAESNNTNKPFSFMLDLPVSVTQWHGNTAFQQPHYGIDFLVSNRNLYAIGDGTIEAKLWDTYGGDCNSGGYALRIKHDNGMHSVYMHLKNDLDGSLTGLNIGDKVKKGDFVAVSSNTGYYNCQPLSDHLHYELRKGRLQSTHVDPVAYINTDWDSILTKDYKANPGRLTGDNPHPGR